MCEVSLVEKESESKEHTSIPSNEEKKNDDKEMEKNDDKEKGKNDDKKAMKDNDKEAEKCDETEKKNGIEMRKNDVIEIEKNNDMEMENAKDKETENTNDKEVTSQIGENSKASEADLPETIVQEDKNVTDIDDIESLSKMQTDNKLNGSFTADVAEEKDELKLDFVIQNPATPTPADESTPILTSSESLTPSPKKKKRRLSGMMAEYRKKKKKSKKSKKKDEKDVEPRSWPVPVQSSVKITRFSLEQLENMRESIRSKNVVEELLKESSSVPDDITMINSEHKEATEVEETEMSCKNVPEAEPVVHDSAAYSIDFKSFTGAILVIKVIENTVLAASDKGQIFCFDLFSGELLKTVNIATLAVTSLIVVSNKDVTAVYAGSLDMQLTILSSETKEIVKQETLSEPIQCMEHSWNFIFVGSDRGSLIRFDLDTESVVDETKISNFNILMMKASLEGPRKILVVATRNSAVSIRDALSGLLLRTMETTFLPTVYTLLIDNNLVYCGTSQHGILAYTFEDGQLALQHEATKSKGVVCMQIVGDLLFAGCYNGNIYVYNKTTNAYVGTMNGPGGLMLSMEIVDEKIIVGTKSSNFKAWKIPQEYFVEK